MYHYLIKRFSQTASKSLLFFYFFWEPIKDYTHDILKISSSEIHHFAFGYLVFGE